MKTKIVLSIVALVSIVACGKAPVESGANVPAATQIKTASECSQLIKELVLFDEVDSAAYQLQHSSSLTFLFYSVDLQYQVSDSCRVSIQDRAVNF